MRETSPSRWLLGIHDGEGTVAGFGGQEVLDGGSDGHAGGKGFDGGGHDFPGAGDGERIDAVLAGEVMAPAGDFFGQDGAFHQQQGDSHAGGEHGDDASRFEFEQEELDGRHDGPLWNSGCRRHAGAGTGDDQCLALGVGQGKTLGHQRRGGTSGHNDRPFGAEGATGSDRNRRGDRLKNGHPEIEPRAAEQNGLDRFRDSMQANLFPTIACHKADEQGASHRYADRPRCRVAILQHPLDKKERACLIYGLTARTTRCSRRFGSP